MEAGEWFEGKDVSPNRVEMSTFFVGKTRPKPGASGGLKKAGGGLKGLKARKEKKAEEPKAEAPAKREEPPKTPSPEVSLFSCSEQILVDLLNWEIGKTKITYCQVLHNLAEQAENSPFSFFQHPLNISYH